MADCSASTWRDLLPDRVGGLLDEAESRAVDAHVATCAACADEVRLLALVHAARLPRSVSSVEQIVRQLPPPPAPRTVIPLAEAPSRRRRASWGAGPAWRWAASLLGMLGVAGALQLADRPARPEGSTVAVEDGGEVVRDSGLPATVSVSYGALGDLTEAELGEMMTLLDGWDGATNPEIAMTPLVLTHGEGR